MHLKLTDEQESPPRNLFSPRKTHFVGCFLNCILEDWAQPRKLLLLVGPYLALWFHPQSTFSLQHMKQGLEILMVILQTLHAAALPLNSSSPALLCFWGLLRPKPVRRPLRAEFLLHDRVAQSKDKVIQRKTHIFHQSTHLSLNK